MFIVYFTNLVLCNLYSNDDRHCLGPVLAADFPTWKQCRDLLFAVDAVTLIYARKIDMCPCDKTIYYGMSAYFEYCPHCYRKRIDDSTGFASKHFWDLGLIEQLRLWYLHASKALEVTPTMRSNSKFELLDITDSPRWKEKMIDSGYLAADKRHLGLLASWDGLNPYGQFSSYSMQTGQYCILNLPSVYRSKATLIIQATIIPGPKKPKTMEAFMQFEVNKLKMLERGVAAIDGSRVGKPSNPSGEFRMKATLIAIILDYPGILH